MDKIIGTMNSGGKESLVAIKRMHDMGYKQRSIIVNMGQPNFSRANESAKMIADKYCISHEVITLHSDSRDTFSTSNRINNDVNIKERIPYTTLIFPMITAIVCVCEDLEILSLGGYMPNRKGDTPLSAHARLDAILNNSFTGQRIKLLQPLEDIRNIQDLLLAGQRHGLTMEDFDLTVSCNSAEPCGECLKCVVRQSNGIKPN